MAWSRMVARGLAALLLASLAASEPAQKAAGLLAKRRDDIPQASSAWSPAAVTSVSSSVRLYEEHQEQGLSREEGQAFANAGRIIDVVFRTQLTDPNAQWVNAVLAVLIGLVLLIADCRIVFKWCGVGGVAMFVMLLAMHEVQARWPFGFQGGAAPIVGVEAALLSAWVALKGYQGMMVLVGALLGVFLAHLVCALCSDFGYHGLEASSENRLMLFTVFVLGGIAMIRQKGHMILLTYINPFLGGALTSSALCWGITALMVEEYTSTWSQVLEMLGSGSAADARLFGKPGQRWPGVALWFAFFVIGTIRQETINRRQRVARRASERQKVLDEMTN